jgi:glycosyltransferase involved in cell wall biosynthesis
MEGVRQITPHLLALGVNTTVASLDAPDEPWLNNQGFKALGLGPVHGGYGYRRGLPARIRELALQHDAAIIHGLWQYHALASWRGLRDSGVPYYVYPHGMLDPWFKREYPRKHLKKWTYWPWADYRVLRDAKAVLFTTEQERQLAQQSFWLYKANEVVVGYGTSAPPGNANLQRHQFYDRFPSLREKRILLFLSRIHPKKGIDLLIEAFSVISGTNPRLQLVVAGPDQLGWQASLEKRADELGIANRVTWVGMLTGDLKWGAFHAAELFCLPSHQENFGIVVAEALACGVPVAVAEPVNIASEIAAAKAGLVHSDSVAGTQAALGRWLELSEIERKQMGERARRLFQQKFDFASVARNLMPVLNGSSSGDCLRGGIGGGT